MMKKNSRKGYALIEAMLSLVLIGTGVAWSAKIANNNLKDQQVRGVVETVDSFIYGMDKRVLLDGANWTGGEFSAGNAKDSFSLIKNALVGSNDAACAGGGWNATYVENSKTALISCYAINPSNMPFGLDMSVSATQTPQSATSADKMLKDFKVTLFYPTDEAFKKHIHVFFKLYSYSKVMSSPRITGSHKYALINRDTEDQITMAECTRLKSKCGFSAEYMTNESGVSESPYLMVNGDNFMVDDLRFQDISHPETSLKCTTVDDLGNPKSVDCGLDTTGTTLNEVSTKSFNKGFFLVGDTSSVKLQCPDAHGATKACGLVAVGNKAELRINALSTDDINSKNITFSKNLSSENKKFDVDAVSGDVQGNDIWGTGYIHSKYSVFTDDHRSGNNHSAELGSNGLHQKGNNGNHVNINTDGSVDVNSSSINLNGSIAKTNVAASNDVDTRTMNQYVTKNFLSRYNMITGVRYGAVTGSAVNVSNRCLAGRSPEGIFIPKEIPVRSEYSDQARCANSWGQRLAAWKVTVKQVGQTSGAYDWHYGVSMRGSVGCSLSRDTWVRWGTYRNGTRFTPYMTFTDYGAWGNNVRNLTVQAGGDLLFICPQVY